MKEVPKGRPPGRFIFLTDEVDRLESRNSATVEVHVSWRVLAANNRTLGESATSFGSVDEAYDSLVRLRSTIDQAKLSLAYRAGPSRWVWLLAVGDDVVAQSRHSYQRRLECLRAAGQFIKVLGSATPIVDEVRHVGQRVTFPDGLRLPPVTASPLQDPTFGGK